MKIKELLHEKGLRYETGLSSDEIKKIEKLYDIRFPLELKQIYMELLPTSKGFYKWRDFSDSNIEYIKRIILSTFEDVKTEIEYIEWNELWGKEPDESEKRRIIEEKLKTAPKLIPIYSHRYVVSGERETSPVLSICGLDIIYYGENLNQYFEIEFNKKSPNEMDYKKIAKVPFWSEIM